MKKISLKNLNLMEIEQLSRTQLKEVLGGGSTLTSDSAAETATEDCAVGCDKEGGSCTTSDCKTGNCAYRGNSLVCMTS